MTLADEVAKKGLRLEKLIKYRSTNMGYEVWAPEGFRFTDGCHSVVEYDSKGVRELIKQSLDVEPCPVDCECKE